MIIHGDCLEVLRGMESNLVDAVVTDPPYGLSFMGKKWDYDVPSVEIWAECLRVLKPGGHLLAFAGTRTQHRMAVRIEDAGFEIRDMIAWVYSTGFPKSFNLDRRRGEEFCGCERTSEQKPECVLRSVRNDDVSEAVNLGQKCGEVLQSGLQEQGSPATGRQELPAAEVRGAQSGMEGWGYAQASKGELQGREICPCAGVGVADGSEGRVHNGTSPCYGEDVRVSADKDGSCGSLRPQSIEQSPIEPGPVPDKRRPQAWRGWAVCSGCGKPIIPSGFGTALKPALEPITVARKPIVGTVAENVLAHGTGGINVDGCRVATDDKLSGGHSSSGQQMTGGWERPWMRDPEAVAANAERARQSVAKSEELGRWPANLIHDGSDDVAALMGESARFFYAPKASKKDRGDGNNHPTVKPTDLMRYLCRLVTPPNGTVLDPFCGSGSTGKAATLEGFEFIGIEREAEYVEIARARVSAVYQQADLHKETTQTDLFAN